jgi:hypothetical protein
MGIGPFTTYAPPGVYTRTTAEPAVGQLLGGLRVPVLVGTGKETLSQTDFEIIRGSSSVADTPIFGEDAAGRWVTGGTNSNPAIGPQDGSYTRFRVRNYPVVDGNGTGKVTYDPSKISVTVNGQQVVVSQLDGQNGIVSLLLPTELTDNVSVSYYFHRKDTRVTDNVSGQVTDGSAVLIAPQAETYDITTGTNDVLYLILDDTTPVSVTLAGGMRTAAEVANDITAAAVSGLSASVYIDAQGLSHVQLVALGNILISTDSPNAASALGFNPGDYTGRSSVFRVFNGPIVDGLDGGITTTDTSKVVVMVNGVQVIASAVDGANRLVTLPFAPKAGSIVTIQYYFNTFQDTFDYLPNSNVVTVGNVGIAPGRRDYVNGTDFIVVNDRDQSIIQWGTAIQVASGQKTGNISFDGTQVYGLLVDNRMYGAECERYTDSVTNTVSTTKFVMPLTPTTGNGRDTPLGTSLYQTVTNGRIDLPTDRPDLVTVYIGKTFRDAFSRPAVPVMAVESSTGTLTLKNPVPADYKAYATFWYNTIVDEQYTLKCTASGPSGIGKFTVTADSSGQPMFQVRFGSKTSLPQTVQWPSGVERLPDAIHYGGAPVSETITVTFDNSLLPATHASFSNASPGPYDIYTYSRMFGNVIVDGTPVSVDLSTAFEAQLLSDPIDNPAALVFAATDYLALRIDGVDLDPVPLTGLTTLTAVAAAVNAFVDTDVQTHSDGSGTFADSSGLDTIIDLANDVRTQYIAHLAAGTWHLLADSTNTILSPAATNWTSVVTLLNELRTKYTGHLAAGTWHGSGDATNVLTALAVTTGNPTTASIALALALVNDLRTQYEAHRIDTSGGLGTEIHSGAGDATNVVTVLAATFSSLGLAVPVTYGTQALLLVAGRNLKTQTNSLVSNVTVLTPTGVGQVDASAKLGLVPGKTANGSWNAINQPATLVGTISEPFTVSAGVNDGFLFGIDGVSYTATIPSGSAVSLEAVVNYVNAWYAGSAPAVDQATLLADAVVLLNSLKTKYDTHIPNITYHPVADAAHGTTAPAATNLATAITLANNIKTLYALHIANSPGAYHTVADSVNVVTAPDATNLRSLLILAYELKTKYNTHIVSTVYHIGGGDVVNGETNSISELVAKSGLGANAGVLTLFSKTNDVTSSVTVGTGTANAKLGFTNNSSASRHQPTPADIAGALNANASFIALAAAWSITAAGLGSFLLINSLTAGLTSTLSFSGAANTAFVDDTNLGIFPGTSGDIGEAAKSGYTVTSSAGASGSSGTGIPGQTYTDAVTGLRFTILPLSVGDYSSGGSFTMLIDSTFTCDANLPWKAIPGAETTVFNTTNVGTDSTAILSTYSRSGTEPQIGDVYYVSYDYAKTDLTTGLYRDLKKIQSNFGLPTPSNPLSLGARLAMLNGSVLVGLKQVVRATNSSQASVAAYTEAIDEQRKPITGNVKPDVITPLVTDPQVFAFLNQHCVFMSAPRQEGERIGVVGPAAGTSSLGVQSISKALLSEMMVVAYPDVYVISIVDEQGNSIDQVVDGSFMAAALAGASCNPSVDVATPWTRRNIQGFKRIGRVLDPTEANQIAVAGVTVMEQVDTGIRVRHGLTTRMDTVITRTPSVTLIIHHVQQSMREVLDPFIGQKFSSSLLKSAEGVVTGLFGNMISQQIVANVAGISATVDENDPTIMRTESIYVPVFPLEYILSSLQIRIRS